MTGSSTNDAGVCINYFSNFTFSHEAATMQSDTNSRKRSLAEMARSISAAANFFLEEDRENIEALDRVAKRRTDDKRWADTAAIFQPYVDKLAEGRTVLCTTNFHPYTLGLVQEFQLDQHQMVLKCFDNSATPRARSDADRYERLTPTGWAPLEGWSLTTCLVRKKGTKELLFCTNRGLDSKGVKRLFIFYPLQDELTVISITPENANQYQFRDYPKAD